jgi:hypothetical protein
MIDRWDEQLRCTQCRNTGMASLSQFKGADMPAVENVSGGFKAVQTEYGPSFHCRSCDVMVS